MTALCLLLLPMMGLNAAPVDADEAAGAPQKELLAPRLSLQTEASSPAAVAQALDAAAVPFHSLDFSWAAFPYKPEVRFRIAHNDKEIFVQYQVREKYLLAECAPEDDACWPSNDSCVEFFVSPNRDDHYFNFEFSCIGYCLIESGKKGPNRTRLPLELTGQVRRESTLGALPFEHKEGDFSWTLTAALPVSLILESEATPLSGKTWNANFYKCGDKLKEQAFMAWNPLRSETPSFHRPEDFGCVRFE